MMPTNEGLLAAREVKVGSQLTVVNEAGITEQSEVIDISKKEITGLANVLTGEETIVVNGIVGSIFAESTYKGVAGIVRPVVQLAFAIGGARAARFTYRSGEKVANMVMA